MKMPHQTRDHRRALFAFAAALAQMGTFKALGATDDHWTNANGGTWTDSPNWSLGLAPITLSYNGIVDLQTSNPYTVQILSSFSVNSIILNSANATITQSNAAVNTSTLTLDAGTYQLNRGSLIGTTINQAGGTFVLNSGTLDNVTVTGGDLQVPQYTSPIIHDSLTIANRNLDLGLASRIYFGGVNSTASNLNITTPGGYATIYVGDSSSGGAATLTLDTATAVSGGFRFSDYYSGSTLINNGSVDATSSAYAAYVSTSNFSNNGTAEATAGATLYLTSNSFTNTGTLTADGSTVYVNAKSWTNAGTFNAINGGMLSLGGSFSTSEIGTLSVGSTSTLAITGMLNNTNATLQPSGGTWVLMGGTITNGTIDLSVQPLNIQSGTFDGVTVTGNDLEVPQNASLDIRDGLTIADQNLDLDYASVVYFGGSISLASNLNITNPDGQASIYIGDSGTTGAATLTLDTNTTVSGGPDISNFNGVTGTLINNGTINATNSSNFLQILTNNFINNGTAEATAGGVLYIQSGSFTNHGTVIADASTVYVKATNWTNAGLFTAINGGAFSLGGSFSTSGLGSLSVGSTSTVSITGSLNNTNASLKPSGGTWLLAGGTITNGTIDESVQPLVFQSGILDGVTVTGNDLQIPQNGSINVHNGLTIANSNLDLAYFTSLYFGGVNPVASNLNITASAGFANMYAGDSTSAGAATLTLASNTTVSGGVRFYDYYGGSTLVNNGTINGNDSNNAASVNTSNFINNGTAEASAGGALSIESASFTNNGTILSTTGATVTVDSTNFVDNGAISTQGGVVQINTGVTVVSHPVTLVGGALATATGDALRLSGTASVYESASASVTLGGPLIVAPAAQDNAVYNLGNSSLTCNQSAFIGPSGIGNFTQTSGMTHITGVLGAGNSGALNLGNGTGKIFVSGGGLYADTILLGDTNGGTGDMTVSGTATVTVGGGAHLNDLTVDGGAFTVLDQTPPTGEDPELNRAVVAGYMSNGALYVNGGDVTSPDAKFGVTQGFTGTYAQTAGITNIGTLALGNDASLTSGSGVGVATISGGGLIVNTILLGSTVGGSGDLTVTGTASVTVGGGAHLNDLNIMGGGVTVLDQNPPSNEDTELNRALVGGYLTNGALIVSGGTLATPYVKLGITSKMTGTFDLTGGFATIGTLTLGAGTTAASGLGIGIANLSGGSLSVGTILLGSTAGGVGSLNISATASVEVSHELSAVTGSHFVMTGGNLTFDPASIFHPADPCIIGNGATAAELHLHDATVSSSGTTVTIGNNGILDGGGSALAAQNVGNAMFAGTNLTLTPNATLHMALGGDPTTAGTAGNTFDQILISGGTFTTGGATLQILALSNVALGKPYPIVITSAGGSINDSEIFADLSNDPTGPSGTQYVVTYSATQIDVTIESVPEPTNCALLIAAAGLCQRRRRRTAQRFV